MVCEPLPLYALWGQPNADRASTADAKVLEQTPRTHVNRLPAGKTTPTLELIFRI
jgi:hypothetical protein